MTRILLLATVAWIAFTPAARSDMAGVNAEERRRQNEQRLKEQLAGIQWQKEWLGPGFEVQPFEIEVVDEDLRTALRGARIHGPGQGLFGRGATPAPDGQAVADAGDRFRWPIIGGCLTLAFALGGVRIARGGLKPARVRLLSLVLAGGIGTTIGVACANPRPAPKNDVVDEVVRPAKERLYVEVGEQRGQAVRLRISRKQLEEALKKADAEGKP